VCDILGCPAFCVEEGDDNDAGDRSDFNSPASTSEDQKQNVADRMCN
jgi:hypothetical protein